MKHLQPTQIVLAAGRSRRMGRPKPLLKFNGKTALEIVIEAGREAGCARSVVVVGHAAENVKKSHAATLHDVVWVLNDDPTSQQLRSLQLGVAAIPDTAFLIHPVDYPLVRAADYRLLIDAYLHGDERDGVYLITHGNRHGHPVLCRGSVAERLLALDPDQTAREVIRAERCVDVHTENSGVLRDMDTPGDYAALLELYRTEKGQGGKGAKGAREE